jgi:ubiquinone/menaquinone biosynthesis C-methylase UbiE
MNKKDTSWGKVADWYDELLEKKDGTYQKNLILPNLLRLLSPQKNEIILDIACGQGFFSRAVASTGASVVGSDIAEELIDIAEQHSPENIKYHVAPADKLSFASDSSVDKAIIVLAIQNIENLQGTFNEVFRVLKSKGKLYFIINHPSFRIPKNSSWEWDDKMQKQYRRIDSYMSDIKEKIEMNPGENNQGDKKYTVSFHRPLQTYFKALNKSGFQIGRLEEWISHKESKEGLRSAEENRIRKEIPMFVIIEAIKN